MTHHPDEAPAPVPSPGGLAGADRPAAAPARPGALPETGTTAQAPVPGPGGPGLAGERTYHPQGTGEPRPHGHHRSRGGQRRSRPGRRPAAAGALVAFGAVGALYAMTGGEPPNPGPPEVHRTLPSVNVPEAADPSSGPSSPSAAAPASVPAATSPAAPATTAPTAGEPSGTPDGATATTGAPGSPEPGRVPAAPAAVPVGTTAGPGDAPAGTDDPAQSPPRETTASPAPAEPRTLRMGDTGPDVTRLQQLLFDQGFTYVTTTGTYDRSTRRGVAQLQDDRDLTGDPEGVYGPATRASLEGT
ncbi:peptidoglycan-binding domain-containing protein [Streptomyces sp. NPDC035033]|uniref:peptidoglycan-binding domain-containing protein n=1 Tax=Streptomyces sp. NPDC035033 TaxID=3155368 RepID=UPI0033E5B2E7